MAIDFIASHVREMKGAALSVFVLLHLTKIPVTQGWLQAMSGYTDKSVSAALLFLRETGRVNRSSAGWMLSGEVQQLPLSVVLDEPDIRNNSDSIINISNIDSEENLEKKTNTNNKIRNNSDSGLLLTEKQEAVRVILAEMGVMLNNRTRSLLELDIEYVRLKAAELKSRGLGKGYAGLFIRNLEDGVPVWDAEAAQAELEREKDGRKSGRYSLDDFYRQDEDGEDDV